MNLYEITNGRTGFSYVRVYAWSENEAAAMVLAKARFSEELGHDESDLEITLLMSDTSPPFATRASSEGWETDSA